MRYFVSVLAIVSILVSAPAFAQNAEKPAETLIKEGLKLRRAGRDIDALDRMQRAYDLEPTHRAAAQVGLCLQAVGRWSEGDLKLSEALSAPDDPWVKKNLATLKDSIESIKVHVGRIEVIGSPEGAEVSVAGRPVGRLPLATPVPVDEGTVDVEARAAGYQPMIRSISVRGGQYQKVVLRLDRSLEPIAVASAPSAMPTSSESTGIVSAAAPAESETGGEPLYKSPWLWGTMGAVVIAGVVTAVLLSSGDSTKTGPIVVDRMETF